MTNKKVLSGPKPSASLYDIVPTILFGCICVVLIAYGDIFNYRNTEKKCLNRDCRIFKAPYPLTHVMANLECKEEWNKTINFDSDNNDKNSTLKAGCHDDGISQCHVIHNLFCQSCQVCFYDVSAPCYSCQKSLKITILKEGIASILLDVINIGSWKKIGFIERIIII